jgi:SOS-response transcriptional repressor LexA
MKELPKRQQEVYNFIEQYHAEHGISPSLYDIAEGLDLSNSTIVTYLKILKGKGRVTSMIGIHRSLRVVPAAAATM